MYGVGYNSDGRLGLGDREGGWRPQEIPFTPSKQIVKIASGYNHTLVILEDGSLWGTGYNYYG